MTLNIYVYRREYIFYYSFCSGWKKYLNPITTSTHFFFAESLIDWNLANLLINLTYSTPKTSFQSEHFYLGSPQHWRRRLGNLLFMYNIQDW
jgi:hypothetical protein